MKMIPSVSGACAGLVLAFHPSAGRAQVAGPAGVLAREGPSIVSITEQTFSLPISEADQLLRDVPSDAFRYARVREMLAGGKGRLERLIVLRTKSGQRAVVESNDELRYASEFRPPEPPPSPLQEKAEGAAPKNPPAAAHAAKSGAISFETRNVGDTLEIEPVVGPDESIIELNFVSQTVSYAGEHLTGGSDPVKTPIFETSKVTTAVSVHEGQPFFVGTVNPPFGNGLAREPKEQRIWLKFFTVDLVRIEPGRGPSKRTSALLMKAESISIAKMEFREVTVAEAVEFLRKKSVELDPVKKGINIVLKAPAELTKMKISLNLTDIPLIEAARYIAGLAALIVEPEDFALTLRAAGDGP